MTAVLVPGASFIVIKTIGADQVNMLPHDGMEMWPHLFWHGLTAPGRFLGGNFKIASIPDNDGIDDQAQRQRAPKLSRRVTVTQTALLAEKDGAGHSVD